MNNHVSKLSSAQVTIFTEMSALATQYNAINLGQGFPDFDPPGELLELVKKHLSDHKNQYAPMAGALTLREALSDKLLQAYSCKVSPDNEITITAGATQAIFTAITAFVHAGDEVIIFEPAYDSYRPSIEIAGGKAVVFTMLPPDFHINWSMVKAMINEKTRMIIINSPHNPTGTTLKEEDLLKLAAVVRDTDIIILSDEVYEHLIYDGAQHQSVMRFPELYARSFAVFSFGKTFHATGWKIGYIAGPEYLTKEFRKVHQWNVFCVNSFIQYALAEYLTEKSHYEYLPNFYQQKRDFFKSILLKTEFKPLKSEGTFFQLADYTNVSELDDVSFTKEMTIKFGIATIPLSVFYSSKEDVKLIRFCFAKTEKLLSAAGEKMVLIGKKAR